MSEAQTITPLQEVLEDVHGTNSEESLREKYAEFLPVDKKARRYPLNPNRVRGKNEYDPAVHESDFAEAESNGHALHGTKRPPYVIQSERPEHRFLVFLYAQGMSTKDVFLQLGGQWDDSRNAPISGTGQYSYQHLHTIRRQAWFQTQLVKYMEQCGKDAIRAKLEMELMPSIETVIEIRDDEDAPKNVRLGAANSLIDRFLGKPVQQVVQTTVKDVDRYEQEAEELAQETARIEAELKNLNPALIE